MIYNNISNEMNQSQLLMTNFIQPSIEENLIEIFEYFVRFINIIIIKESILFIRFQDITTSFYEFYYNKKIIKTNIDDLHELLEYFLIIYKYYYIVINNKFKQIFKNQMKISHKFLIHFYESINEIMHKFNFFNTKLDLSNEYIRNNIHITSSPEYIEYISTLEYYFDKTLSLQKIILETNNLLSCLTNKKKIYENKYKIFKEYFKNNQKPTDKINFIQRNLYKLDLLTRFFISINWYDLYRQKDHLYVYSKLYKKNHILQSHITEIDFNLFKKQLSLCDNYYNYDHFFYLYKNLYFWYISINKLKNIFERDFNQDDNKFFQNIIIEKGYTTNTGHISFSITKLSEYYTQLFPNGFIKNQTLFNLLWIKITNYFKKSKIYTGIEKQRLDHNKIPLNHLSNVSWKQFIVDIMNNHYCFQIKLKDQLIKENLYLIKDKLKIQSKTIQDIFKKHNNYIDLLKFKIFKTRIEQLETEMYLLKSINNKQLIVELVQNLLINQSIINLMIEKIEFNLKFDLIYIKLKKNINLYEIISDKCPIILEEINKLINNISLLKDKYADYQENEIDNENKNYYYSQDNLILLHNQKIKEFDILNKIIVEYNQLKNQYEKFENIVIENLSKNNNDIENFKEELKSYKSNLKCIYE